MLKKLLATTLCCCCCSTLTAESVSLEKIMADPDWIGQAAENAYWGDSSSAIYFEQKRTGEDYRELFRRSLAGQAASKVDDAARNQDSGRNRSYSADRSSVAWLGDGEVFTRTLPGGVARQLTATGTAKSGVTMFSDGSAVSFIAESKLYVHSLNDGTLRQVFDLKFSDDPDADTSFDTLRDQHRRTYSTVMEDKRRREAARDDKERIRKAQSAPRTLFLGKKYAGVGQSLSPSGKYAVLVLKPAKAKTGKTGSMPNYVTEDGYTSTSKTRTRVGKNPPAGQSIRLVNVETGDISSIDLSELPGIDADPLADLRQSALKWHIANGADESAAEKALKAPDQREVLVSSLRWSPDGARIALQLFAVDNKDRWLLSIDAASGEFKTQHRLNDPAWINYHNNEFGWIDNDSLWFLSEESGFSHLYSKKLTSRKHRALTQGLHVVSDPQLNAAADRLYFRSNSTHPSTFEIFSVATKGGKPAQHSQLGGVNHFRLAPDDSKLLISHTEFDRHTDLFVKDLNSTAATRRLTDTVSAEFKAIDWVIPKIVEVPSSHVAQSIFSKIYLPEDYDNKKRYPAVMFVHGAGYTQNAHAGWPYYFREFMFHTLLTQKGYVVIDMDYRASKGYGRDWRTAIYRQMGHPELEDFQDGVKFLTEQYNVDPQRIGIYGGSYGGFMTFMAMFRDPDLFAAGAALRPVVDWMHYNHGYTSNILNTPQIDPVAYQKSSPINFAEGLNKPLLIAVGMQDDNVFFQDSVLLVQRLIELEKQDFEMAVYPLDPHGFVHPSAWLDEYRRILKLFERHLK